MNRPFDPRFPPDIITSPIRLPDGPGPLNPRQPDINPLPFATVMPQLRLDRAGFAEQGYLLEWGRALGQKLSGGSAAIGRTPAQFAPRFMESQLRASLGIADLYLCDAATSLMLCVFGAADGTWNSNKSDAAFRVAFGLDADSVHARLNLLGDRAQFRLPLQPDWPSLLPPLSNFNDLFQLPCIGDLRQSLNQLGAVVSALPFELKSALITDVQPRRTCPGAQVTISGSGFGTSQAANVRLLFPEYNDGVINVSVPSAQWSETRIVATVPANAGCGNIMVVQGDPGAAASLASATDAFIGEATECLGVIGSASLHQVGSALGQFHRPVTHVVRGISFCAGKPRVKTFLGNSSNEVLLRPNGDLILQWDVSNADAVTITGSGSGFLPSSNPHVTGKGELIFRQIPGPNNWTGQYELVATNPCGTVRAVLPVDMRVRKALSLAGGGSKGAFEVGAVRCLYDVFNFRPDVITGASVGSLNAAKLAEGPAALPELEQLWANMQGARDMFELSGPVRTILRTIGRDGLRLFNTDALEEVIGSLPPPAPGAAELNIAGNVVNNMSGAIANVAGVSIAFTISNALLAGLNFGLSIKRIIDAATALWNSQSILLITPVRRTIDTQIDPHRIRGSGIKLRVVVSDLETGKTRYVTETARFNDSGLAVQLRDALQASCSIPVAFTPVRLNDGHSFVDGGVGENIPIEAAVRAGADSVIAVLPSPAELAQEDYSRAILKDIFGRSVSMLFDSAERRQLKPYHGFGVPVTVIAPQEETHGLFLVHPGLIQVNQDYGYMRAFDEMQPNDNIRTALRETSLGIMRLRRDCLSNECRANGANPPGTLPGEVKPAAHSDTLRYVRNLKRQIRTVAAQRLAAANGDLRCLPAGIERVWQQWEKYTYVALNPTPWSEAANLHGTVVAAETPPSALP